MPIDPERARAYIARLKTETFAEYGGDLIGFAEYGTYQKITRYNIYQDRSTKDYFFVVGKDNEGNIIERPFHPGADKSRLYHYDETELDFSKREPLPLILSPVDTVMHPQRRWNISDEAIEHARQIGEKPEAVRRELILSAKAQANAIDMHFVGFAAWASKEKVKIYPVFRFKGRSGLTVVGVTPTLAVRVNPERMPENARFLTTAEYLHGIGASPTGRRKTKVPDESSM